MAWINPDEFYAILRCTNSKYANLLKENGSVMFNTPRKWIEIEEQSGAGQGDRFEGVFAACHFMNVQEITYNYNLYDDVESFTHKGLVYFRRKSVIDLPAYCFFMLKQGLFEEADKPGRQTIKTTIPGRYFQDFADGISLEEVEHLDDDDRPALVMIQDMDLFINMIKDKLISMGVYESEIIVQAISYNDKGQPFYCPAKSPMELFSKDVSFDYQAEGRIVINTEREEILEKIIRKPFLIGSIDGFSQVSETYFHEGILIVMEALVVTEGEWTAGAKNFS